MQNNTNYFPSNKLLEALRLEGLDITFVTNELIAALQKEGFDIGIGKLLKMEQLLFTIDLEEHYAQLPFLLCPLFARNEKEQNLFYRIYADLFGALATNNLTPKPQTETTQNADLEQELKPQKFPEKKWYWVAAFLLLAFTVAGIYFSFRKEKMNTEIVENISKEINSETQQLKDSISLNETAFQQKADSIEQQIQQEEFNQDINVETQQQPAVTQPETKLPTLEELRAEQLNIFLEQRKNDSIERQLQAEQFFVQVEAENKILSYQHQRKIYNTLYITALLILLAIAYEIWKFRNRKLIAQKKKGRKPPFVVQLKIDEKQLDLDSQIYGVANSMRLRTKGSVQK